MKVEMLSRWPELKLAPTRRTPGVSATERLKKELYKKYPLCLEIGSNESDDKRFWKYIANKRTRSK